ncbi:hypothetical protein FRC06_008632, partial [Ceratobasidium sp. 370]
QWREHQAEQVAKRYEESQAKRGKTIATAEGDIVKFMRGTMRRRDARFALLALVCRRHMVSIDPGN